MNRSAGILLPVFSLPGPYGIGTLGSSARAFVDALAAAGQSWWQVLPIGPIGAGASPYTSASTFAGEPLFVDPDLLAAQGLLTADELRSARMPDTDRIDYAAVRTVHTDLLRRAFRRLDSSGKQAVQAFVRRTPWLPAYALYQAARERFGGVSWLDWPDEGLRQYRPEAVDRWRQVLAPEVDFHQTVQFWFSQQWSALRQYAHQRGVSILGDLPIYVSLDSADVWSERSAFLLDETGRPTKVAGVPPDYFSAQGQLWGNPLYDWQAQRADGFGWWIRRVDGAAGRFDAIRIDHFRGLARYWAVPAEAESAEAGRWEEGPGMDLLGVLTGWFPQVRFIAEDLGLLTDEVHQLREAAGLPGMKVLEFAFSGPDNAYLPHNCRRDCLCCTGTHDNDTAAGWYDHAGEAERRYAQDYLGTAGRKETVRGLLMAGQRSVADLFIAQLQDYLGLGSEARINIPGTPEGNWRWRLRPGQLTDEVVRTIRKLTETFGRTGPNHAVDDDKGK